MLVNWEQIRARAAARRLYAEASKADKRRTKDEIRAELDAALARFAEAGGQVQVLPPPQAPPIKPARITGLVDDGIEVFN